MDLSLNMACIVLWNGVVYLLFKLASSPLFFYRRARGRGYIAHKKSAKCAFFIADLVEPIDLNQHLLSYPVQLS